MSRPAPAHPVASGPAPSPAPSRPSGPTALGSAVVALLLVASAIVGVGACRSGSAATPVTTLVFGTDRAGTSTSSSSSVHDGVTVVDDARVDAEDGVLPDGASVFDEHPGVANLDPALLAALRAAARDAADDGVALTVNSGWRSAEYQDQLLREAVAEHGSEEEAARWVATAETSAHVSGSAVDVGPAEAATWLADHGVAYGLCRVYDNEPWHFELLAAALGSQCPATYPDPTHDPRLRPDGS